MKVEVSSLNLLCGNRGFVLSLDALIATLVVILILVASAYYIHDLDDGSFSKLQMVRTGSDILVLLEHEGFLQTLDKDGIENELMVLLPINYDMRIDVNCPSQSIQTSFLPPTKTMIVGGKRVLVRENLEYCTVRYWIWLK